MKRMIDIIIAMFLIVIFLPVLAITCCMIAVLDGAPVIFKQDRMGTGAVPFRLYKFRTMRRGAPRNVPTSGLVDSSAYITRLGRFLRKASIDELPQLVNVLKGDMSLVGPRPVVLSERELIGKRIQKGVYAIRPGITGWAQINGRDIVSIDEKAALDEFYLKNRSMLFDLYILFRTGWLVITRQNIMEGGMPAEKAAGAQGARRPAWLGYDIRRTTDPLRQEAGLNE